MFKNQCTDAHSEEKEIINANLHADGACTIKSYAEYKKIPESFLYRIGLTEIKYPNYSGALVVSIPYFNQRNEIQSTRYRIALSGDDKFRWKKGSKPIPYGLERLSSYSNEYILISEGESCTQTAWLHDIPAIGLPGACIWKNDFEPYFEKFTKICVIIEPDNGGLAMLKWISNSKLKNKIFLVRLPKKDLSELYLSDSILFKANFQRALKDAESWIEFDRKKSSDELNKHFVKSEEIIKSSNILDLFAERLNEIGHVGEDDAAKLLFLILTSRVLSKPSSAVIKGPSSAGKSGLVDRVLLFFPPSAFYALSAVSEKALIYTKESFEHRFIVLYEANGMNGEFLDYIIRSLLSEGLVRYETVEKVKDQFEARLIEKHGPTGLLITTTKIHVHQENETRLLTIKINDSAEQTRSILKAIAKSSNEAEKTFDFESWHSFQKWIELSIHKAKIPFAEILSERIPPIATRLRRDFTQILNLIKTHAIIHQENRKKENGYIIASLEDYEAVKNLIQNILSEEVGSSVPETVKQTCDAVAKLSKKSDGMVTSTNNPVSIKLISRELKLDESTVRRRVYEAIDQGYLENTERPHKPMKLIISEKYPENIKILPDSKDLDDIMQACIVLEEDSPSTEFELEEYFSVQKEGGEDDYPFK